MDSAPTGHWGKNGHASLRMADTMPDCALHPQPRCHHLFPCDIPFRIGVSLPSFFSLSLFPLLPPSKRKWYLFFFFISPCSLKHFLWRRDVPPVNRTVLIKTTYKRSPGAMCAEPAPQRDGPSWTTFELKRMFLFTSTSFQLNKGKLKGSHLNPGSIKLYIFHSW